VVLDALGQFFETDCQSVVQFSARDSIGGRQFLGANFAEANEEPAQSVHSPQQRSTRCKFPILSKRLRQLRSFRPTKLDDLPGGCLQGGNNQIKSSAIVKGDVNRSLEELGAKVQGSPEIAGHWDQMCIVEFIHILHKLCGVQQVRHILAHHVKQVSYVKSQIMCQSIRECSLRPIDTGYLSRTAGSDESEFG
jgi:hypothetical protein